MPSGSALSSSAPRERYPAAAAPITPPKNLLLETCDISILLCGGWAGRARPLHGVGLETLPVFASQVLVRGCVIRDFHLLRVVQQLPAAAQRGGARMAAYSPLGDQPRILHVEPR